MKKFIDLDTLKVVDPPSADEYFSGMFVELTEDSLNEHIFGELTRLQSEYIKGLIFLSGDQ